MKNSCYSNRELSWLKCNGRVLEEAADGQVPLCERLTFASIFQSNLDEFFMVRVGSLQDQMLFSPERRDNKTKLTAKEQIEQILKAARELCKKKDQIYAALMTELKGQGVELLTVGELTQEELAWLGDYFHSEIQPLISPQVVGKRQPFPFLKNKEIYAIVELVDGKGSGKGSSKVGIIPCSNGLFERLVPLPTAPGRFLLMEDVILHFAKQVFEHYKIRSQSLLRIVRNADLEPEEESIFDDVAGDEEPDYREGMAKLIKLRKKLSPIRVELSQPLEEKLEKRLLDYLELKKERLFISQSPLEMSFVFGLQDALREKPELFYAERVPQKSPEILEGVPMMEQIMKKDLLLSYPYESIQPFLRLLSEAGEDPSVVSIKMTLYRVARYSKVIEALIKAAENGKEVVVLVELRARFDEENNIEWSRRLEEAGCRIIYGLDGLKVHSKLCLITRKTKKKIQYITQIGTGNYNEKTSTLYTDYSLMTASTDIGLEAVSVFHALLMGEICPPTSHLLVAPNGLRQGVLAHMEEEMEIARGGGKAYIGLKLNSLTDKVLIEKLIEASQAGVKIEMVVRGICCLIPGVKGMTDNITVVSIVGRFLEHARIYMFGVGDRQQLYISSADFMTRNTSRRIEVAVRVEDKRLQRRIAAMFRKQMSDNVKGRVLKADGTYVHKTSKSKPLNSQEYFYEQAYQASEKAEKKWEAEKEAAMAKAMSKSGKNTKGKGKSAGKGKKSGKPVEKEDSEQ